MRSTKPLRARAQSQDQLQTPSPPLETPPQPESMSTIRLISAPPTAAGPAPGLGDPFIDTSVPSSPFITVSHPTPLAPKMEAQAVRKRLVPKKSKLGLLVSGKRSKAPENSDFNDAVRRLGGSTTAASGAKDGFEIYVDPAPRSEVGEVLMVKKKKSRAALSGLRWGNLTDVTNSAPSKAPTQTVGLKSGDKEKWWSIGRGRKDSKDTGPVEKENARVNPSRAPSETLASRTRFNSLDSNVILSAPCKTTERPAQVRSASASESPLQDPGLVKDASHVPTTSCLAPEEMHGLPLPARPNTTTGSIAIRAMRSMRSIARLGNWTNGRPMEKEATNPTQPMRVQTQHAKRTKKKDKRKLDLGRDQMTSRLSNSSSEACVPANVDTPPIQAPTTRKHGVLGLGFPSSLRFGTMRSSSAGSCTQVTARSDCRGRSSSTVSTASSLRLASAKSRISSTSSASVKWVEERLETVKLACRRERIAERRDETQCDSKEVRPRGAVVDVFPEYMPYSSPSKSTPSALRPIGGTVEGTLIDGYFVPRGEMIATPCRQTRVRPASDQMTGKERLGTICQDPDGVISALDAATNELASLINRLDLEATPGTPRGSLRLSPSFTTLLAESPRLKNSPNEKGSSATLQMYPNVASLPSRRPCQQSQKREDVVNTQRLGQQIAPWPISPPKALQVATPNIPPRVSSTPGNFVTTSLASEQPAPRPGPSIVFQSLRPAMSKKPSQLVPLVSMSPSQKSSPTSTAASNVPTEKSSITFRSMSKKKSIDLLADSQKEFPLSKTFRKMMSTFSLSSNKEIKSSLSPDHAGVPMTKEARGALGLAGTLGGSMSSRNTNQSMNLDDPDCDIPNELQVILTGGVTQHLGDPEDTLTFLPASLTRRPPSPGLPPECPLPIPTVPQTSAVHSGRSVLSVPWMGEAQPEDPDESDSSSFGENDTKRSFDFTSELKRLSESAGTQRRSFVEQLENAFRTPAKYSLDGLGHFELEGDAPPMPSIPHLASRRRLLDEPDGPNSMTSSPVPSLLPSPEIVVSKPTGTPSSRDLSQSRLQKLSASSKPSYGQLNLDFKFGGSPLSAKSAERSQMTLSDIIPSPAHAHSLSMASMREGDSPQESSVPHVRSAPPSSYSCARRRVDSDSSSKRSIHGDSRGDACSSHSRASSQISFKGLETFDEIRRGFEFVENRPAFYPPSFNNRHNQLPRDSMISIASVSSYGVVINPGVKDPFDYGYQSRPASADMSAFVTMSTSVDDTFSFIRRGRRRKRVDSDSSSFYFGVSGASRISRPLRDQFRRDSVISTTSIAPPVSIYNRSFGVHRRIDSSSSVASGSHAYAAYRPAGANRSSWAPSHRRDMSADSMMSDTSVRISRPTLGDKMLDSRHDYCLPLTSITASPPESLPSDYSYRHVRRRGSFDSIMDDECRSYSRDSIMDQSKRRSSSTPESVFGQDVSHPNRSPLDHFRINDGRPYSLFSVEGDSAHHKRDDDTMISMIGGGRVRRCSVGSFVERSPIFIRVGKRKAAVVPGQQRNVTQQPEVVESPVATQRVEKSPSGLGEERMVFAREGLLSRDSLEEHCLCADGVETSFMAEPVFSRPVPVSRSRSGTHSSTSSGLDTPSLSSSGETSSVASDSISSIDLSRVNLSLTNMSYPIIMQSRSRIRSKGHGHRRRLSGIQISRTSVYETIEEENNTPVTDGFPDSVKAVLSPVIDDNVIIVDPDDASSVEWDERGVVALRKYYTLKDEADITIKESKQLWLDTPFSIYAVQSFEPPAHRSGMRALLENSLQTYGPLSAELRRIRSRTNSRPSPYPQPQRAIKISLSPPVPSPKVPPSVAPNPVPKPAPAPSAIPAPILATQTLQQRTVNRNTAADEISSLMPGKVAKGNSSSFPQSRLGPNARRSAPGWVKRGVGKENQERGLSSGAMTAPSESMRLNRPRPRGRPTHTRAIAPIRA